MWMLHIDSVVAVLLLAPTLGVLTLMGSQLGVLQGSQRWTELAAVYISAGVGRLVLGGGALLVHPSLDSAMIGLALGAAVPPLLGQFFLPGSAGPTAADQGGTAGVHARHAHAARVLRDGQRGRALRARAARRKDSGYYAAGLIVPKACLFLPQFVIVLVFPSLASSPGDTGGYARRSPPLPGSASAPSSAPWCCPT